MRLRSDPFRVDISELAIVASRRLEQKFWRFGDLLEDVERAFREDPFSYNMRRLDSEAFAGRQVYVAVTPAFPGCLKLRWLVEIEGDVVRIWAISPPGEPELDAEIIKLFEAQGTD